MFFWSPVCAAIEAFPFQNNFLLWLKYHQGTFSQSQINTYPLGVQAVGIAANMLAAWHMDTTGQRMPMAILACLLQVVVGVMLLIPSLPFAGTFFAFYLSGTAYMVNPLIFGWANIILQRSGDDAVRGVTLYCMNIGSMVLWTFWGILFYNGSDAPYWKNGSIVLIVCSAVMGVYTLLMKKVSFNAFGVTGLNRLSNLVCFRSTTTLLRNTCLSLVMSLASLRRLLQLRSKTTMSYQRSRKAKMENNQTRTSMLRRRRAWTFVHRLDPEGHPYPGNDCRKSEALYIDWNTSLWGGLIGFTILSIEPDLVDSAVRLLISS